MGTCSVLGAAGRVGGVIAAGGETAAGASPESNRLSCLSSGVIAFRVQLAHFILDPVLNPAVDLFVFQAGRFDDGPDVDGNKAGFFYEGIARPALSGVVCNRSPDGARAG